MSEENFQQREQQREQEQIREEQRQQEQTREHQKEQGGDGKVCPSCSHVNSSDSMFCESCGCDLGGGETECHNCGEMSSGKYCPFCGIDKDGYMCVKCNKIRYSVYCPECGVPLNESAVENERKLDEPIAALQEMSEQQAVDIIKELKDSLTPEMQEEYEKKRERLIYRQEMEYASERDRRIEAYLSKQTVKITVLDPEEMAYIRETVERLKSFNLKEKQRNDEEIRIREEKARLEEIARQEKLDRVKREEAVRQRVEIEKRERERHHTRIDGIWISTSPTWIETMKLNLRNGSLTGSSHWKVWGGGDTRECVFTLVGEWDGSNFRFHSTHIKDIHGKSGQFRFFGTVNDAGTILSGYFVDNTKSKTQQIFFKQ